MLNKTQILAIPSDNPEKLFSTPDKVGAIYLALAKQWHPDKGGDSEVFAHIHALRLAANRKITENKWEIPGLVVFGHSDGEVKIRFKKKFDFEMGVGYISQNILTYLFRNDFSDIAQWAEKSIKSLRFADDKMKEIIGRDMPKIKAFKKVNEGYILVLEKEPHLVRLRDLLEFYGGKIDPRHVAWITSRMLSHAAYFEWAGLSHNDFSLDTIFVCPADHTASILGGWGYVAALGGRLSALPQRTAKHGPQALLRDKIALSRTDTELSRLTACELLGSMHHSQLARDSGIPKPLLDWTRQVATGSARNDLRNFREKTLTESFGPAKFLKMEATASSIYNF